MVKKSKKIQEEKPQVTKPQVVEASKIADTPELTEAQKIAKKRFEFKPSFIRR